MRILARQRDLQPPQALTMRHNPNRLSLGLQDGPLFDMQLEHRMDLARANHLIAHPADPRQFLAKNLALQIAAALGIILGVDPREHARGQHGRRKPRALLVRPVRHHNRMPGLHALIVHASAPPPARPEPPARHHSARRLAGYPDGCPYTPAARSHRCRRGWQTCCPCCPPPWSCPPPCTSAQTDAAPRHRHRSRSAGCSRPPFPARSAPSHANCPTSGPN